MSKQQIVLSDISDPKLKTLLQEIDTDESGTIDVKEVQTALENKKLLEMRFDLFQKRALVFGCISIAVNVGLVFAVVYLAKDTKVNSGVLTDMNDVPLKVKNADVQNLSDGTMADSSTGNDLKVATKTYTYSIFDLLLAVPKEENVEIQNITYDDKNVTISLGVQGVYRHWSEDAVYACLLTTSSIEALVVRVPYDENAKPGMTSVARKDCETRVWYKSVGRDLSLFTFVGKIIAKAVEDFNKIIAKAMEDLGFARCKNSGITCQYGMKTYAWYKGNRISDQCCYLPSKCTTFSCPPKPNFMVQQETFDCTYYPHIHTNYIECSESQCCFYYDMSNLASGEGAGSSVGEPNTHFGG